MLGSSSTTRIVLEPPLVSPALTIVAMTVVAAGIAVTTGLFGDPAAIAVMPPILAAIIIGEAAFGVGGVVLAPIVYAFVKRELADRGLV